MTGNALIAFLVHTNTWPADQIRGSCARVILRHVNGARLILFRAKRGSTRGPFERIWLRQNSKMSFQTKEMSTDSLVFSTHFLVAFLPLGKQTSTTG